MLFIFLRGGETEFSLIPRGSLILDGLHGRVDRRSASLNDGFRLSLRMFGRVNDFIDFCKSFQHIFFFFFRGEGVRRVVKVED